MRNLQPSISSTFLILLLVDTFIDSVSPSPSCPIDFSYVETFPWDTSLCRSGSDGCCQTLLSLFGMGLAQNLKDTSMFQLPNVTVSSFCLSDFRAKLIRLSILPSLVPLCFQNSTQFAANASYCDGIMTVHDWREKVGPNNPLDAFCEGDLTGTWCNTCVQAGMQVNSLLLALDPNSTKCFYFAVLYAAGIVNKFGPKDSRTASCVLGLPIAQRTRNSLGSLSHKKLLKLAIVLLGGAFIGVLLAFWFVILYRNREREKRQNARHEEYMNSFRDELLLNTGAK